MKWCWKEDDSCNMCEGKLKIEVQQFPEARVQVLDHGYLQLIEKWGSDERIIEAARMSTNKGFQGWGQREQCEYCGCNVDEIRNTPAWLECAASGAAHHFGPFGPPGDEKLLRYLYEHKHATPFEMAGIVIEVQAPIFVFREWHRHRTQSYNEMSARYTPLPNINYVPSQERCFGSATKNKQAQSYSMTELSVSDVATWLSQLESAYAVAQACYEKGLQLGIPKEVARLPVPVARYSRMRASANLRNWLAFLTLRMDEHAQWEIRQYANEVAKLVEKLFPRTYALFVEGRRAS